MALIKLSKNIESIHGQFGGVYFIKNSSGQHIQAMPRQIYNTFGGTAPPHQVTHSFSRGSGINSFTALIAAYLAMSLLVYFPLWALRALGWISEEGKSKGKPLPVINWWIKFNMSRELEGLPIYTDPPIDPGRLPVYVVEGNFWGPRNVNLYPTSRAKEPSNMHFSPEWPVYLGTVGDEWILLHSTEMADFRWRRPFEAGPIGVYLPDLEWQGTCEITY